MSTYFMIPFIKNSRNYNLNYSDSMSAIAWGWGEEVGRGKED